jgi:hypothetical protein
VNQQGNQMTKEFVTSKGGIVKVTPTGLVHTPTSGFYSGEIAESGVMPTLPVKRGRGRPRKDSGETGAKFDFSAFKLPKVPKWKGESRKFFLASKGE